MDKAESKTEPSKDKAGKSISRRKFLKWTGVAAGLAVAGSAADAFAIEPTWIDQTNPVCRIKNLPPAWDGVRIAQLTDIHAGKLVSMDQIREIVDITNAMQPDIVVMTGDFVSQAKALTGPLTEIFRDLRARAGRFAVLGNHDYWADAPGVIRSFELAGVKMLTNRHEILTRNGQKLCIAGVDDLMAGNPDVAAALAGVPDDVPRILLCHNPDYAELLPKGPRVDFMLSGHTHGGQVSLPLFGPLMVPIKHKKYVEGLVTGPRCDVYISRGLGMVYVPARFNCRPELPVFTLRRA